MIDEIEEGQIWHPRDSATRVKIVSVHLLAETVRVRRMDKASREVVLGHRASIDGTRRRRLVRVIVSRRTVKMNGEQQK